MGQLDRLRGASRARAPGQGTPSGRREVVIGAQSENLGQMTFEDRNITFTGDLSSYNYDTILRDKQGNINSLYEQADYYVDKDPIFRGIILGVYTPFSVSGEWRLVGVNAKTKRKLEEHYEKIHLRDRMLSIFYQYYKYGNVYIYMMPNGSLITQPVHKVRVGNIMVNGEPVIEFNAKGVRDDLKMKSPKALQNYEQDENQNVRLDGYPPEVSEALNGNAEWVQLNPERTFVLQGIKEDWMRYAVPMVAAALTALSKKALIERFEVAQLNLGMRSFLHVTYGDDDPNGDLMPDVGMLNGVQALFKRAMTGGGIATTNPWAKAQFIQLDTKELFQYDKYRDVNAEILASGGVSGIIVSGRAEDGSTFASAQVSIQTVAMRIQQAKDNFCEMMNKVNRRLCEGKDAVIRVPAGTVPRFTFPPTDLSNSTKLQEACYKLWKDGVLSNSTMLKVHGYDMEQENALIRDESDKGIARPSIPQGGSAAGAGNQPGTSSKVGRPEMDDSDRSSDKSKAQSGKAPKPSNPEGSL